MTPEERIEKLENHLVVVMEALGAIEFIEDTHEHRRYCPWCDCYEDGGHANNCKRQNAFIYVYKQRLEASIKNMPVINLAEAIAYLHKIIAYWQKSDIRVENDIAWEEMVTISKLLEEYDKASRNKQ